MSCRNASRQPRAWTGKGRCPQPRGAFCRLGVAWCGPHTVSQPQQCHTTQAGAEDVRASMEGACFLAEQNIAKKFQLRVLWICSVCACGGSGGGGGICGQRRLNALDTSCGLASTDTLAAGGAFRLFRLPGCQWRTLQLRALSDARGCGRGRSVGLTHRSTPRRPGRPHPLQPAMWEQPVHSPLPP